jgi:hypothetical protein
MINKTDSKSCAVGLIDLYLIFPDAVLIMLKSGINMVGYKANPDPGCGVSAL